MSRKSSYNSKMTVRRLNLTGQSITGGIEQVIISVGTVACRIRQLKANEIPVAGKMGEVSSHRVYSSNKVNIQPKDTIIINSVLYDVNTVDAHCKGDAIQFDVTRRI